MTSNWKTIVFKCVIPLGKLKLKSYFKYFNNTLSTTNQFSLTFNRFNNKIKQSQI